MSVVAQGGQTRAYRDEDGTIQVGIRPLPTSGRELAGNVVSDVLDGVNVAATVTTGGVGGAGILLAKTGAKSVIVNSVVQAGKKINKNTNTAEGNFVLYEVKDKTGKVIKVGKANADDVMSDGTIRRVHTSERKAQQAGYSDAKAEVVQDLGTTTTGKAKEVEAARAREYRANGNRLPLNREKDKRYTNQ